MPRNPKPAPDPSQPVPPTLSEFRAKLDDGNFDTDFAELAARFGAHGGGSLAPELCAELALEIVLNDIVERACIATGATGAAIVLRRDGELVCRARSGDMAPELGARLEGTSGLSGECLRTHQTQSCDDVLDDPRANLEASQRLGARSVIVMPLLGRAELVGVFELFSFRPHAFGEREKRILESLCARTLNNMERASEYARQLEYRRIERKRIEHKMMEQKQFEQKQFEQRQPEEKPTEQRKIVPVNEARAGISAQRLENSSRRRFDPLTWTLGAAVLACAIGLGVLAGRRLESQRAAPGKYALADASMAVPASAAASETPGVAKTKDDGANSPAQQPVDKAVASSPGVAPGGLMIFENGREVFRMPPGQSQIVKNQVGQSEIETKQSEQYQAASSTRVQGTGLQPASSAEREKVIAPTTSRAASVLLRRVEPEYPEEARKQGIQGVVVLEVHIGADGTVQDVVVVSGPPELVEASKDAVKQWKFKTYTENGQPMEMQSRVSLNFKLPRQGS